MVLKLTTTFWLYPPKVEGDGHNAVQSAQVQRFPSEKAMASTSPDEILTRVEVGKPSATGTRLENIGKSRLLRAFSGQLDSSASRPPSVLKPSTR